MSRFEKKCFVGSAALHGLLIVVFLFGSAFLWREKTVVLPPVVTMYANVTDKLIASGGNPQAKPAEPPRLAQPPKIETPQTPPEPPKPEVKREVKPKEPDSEPVKPKRTEVAKPPEKKHDKTPDKAARREDKPDSDKKLALKPIRHTNNLELARQEMAARAAREKAARAEREARARYEAQLREVANQVSGIVSDVRSGISHETVAEVVGPGGAAYVNYASLIIEKYRAAVYASHPQSDTDAEAMIRVVIARDGTVRSSQWVRRTGNSVLNGAVERAMKTVRSLPEFPREAKDSERTFNITIAFEARKVSA